MVSLAEKQLIIKLSNQKKSTWTISNMTGIPQSTVAYWTKRFSETNSLENKPRSGRPTPLTKEVLKILKKRLVKKINSANEQGSGLNTKELRLEIKDEVGVSFSLRYVRDILHRLNFSKITPRTEHIRASKEARDEFRKSFQKKRKKFIWITK